MLFPFSYTHFMPATGSCPCAGMLGPMLGGGHSILQGYYGTLADNLIEARVVLAEGDAITVSANSNVDMFWALRGAGHNFGIISEYKYKIYDHPNENKWAFVELMFAGHQLEDLYRQINKLSNDGKDMHPVQLVYLASYLRDADIDSKNVRAPFTLHSYGRNISLTLPARLSYDLVLLMMDHQRSWKGSRRHSGN
jgi:FAD/FMN-containing dehydrogenase